MNDRLEWDPRISEAIDRLTGAAAAEQRERDRRMVIAARRRQQGRCVDCGYLPVPGGRFGFVQPDGAFRCEVCARVQAPKAMGYDLLHLFEQQVRGTVQPDVRQTLDDLCALDEERDRLRLATPAAPVEPAPAGTPEVRQRPVSRGSR